MPGRFGIFFHRTPHPSLSASHRSTWLLADNAVLVGGQRVRLPTASPEVISRSPDLPVLGLDDQALIKMALPHKSLIVRFPLRLY